MAAFSLISRRKADRTASRRGFTLSEVLVATGLSSLVLAGVLTASVQLVRSSARLQSYAEMDTQVRRAFERLSRDLKSASDVTWNSASDLTVTIPTSATTSTSYTYAWSSTTRSFYRVPGTSSASTSGRVQLITGVPPLANGSAGVTFARQDKSGNAATTNNATKRIQITVTLSRSSSGAAASTSRVTATFMLRNKPVS